MRRRDDPQTSASWMDRGACYGEDQDLWFPEVGESAADAKAICARCPVRETCLDFAMANHIKHGVWGGLTVRERNRLRKQRRSR